jgi:hypothetical protein
MVHTQASTPLSVVQVEHRGPLTDVWLRKNIRDDVADNVYGSDIAYWEADEVYGVINGHVTEEEVASRFDELWVRFEEDSMGDRELIEARTSGMRDILGPNRSADAATRNVQKGEFVVTNTAIYQAIVNIPRGASLVEGMNVVRTNVEAQLNALQERE